MSSFRMDEIMSLFFRELIAMFFDAVLGVLAIGIVFIWFFRGQVFFFEHRWM